MNKLEFINALRQKLSGLPQREVEERLGFYAEMIDDRMEEGLPEEDAVSEIGSVDSVAEQILSEIPLSKIAKESIKPQRKLAAWEIVLICVSLPVWLPLLCAAFAVIVSIYAVIWSLIVALWAIFVSLAACAVGVLAAAVVLSIFSNPIAGVWLIGASLLLAGLSIFLFFACREATRGTALLTKAIALGIKKLFIKKEVA